jgi:putative transposase
MAQICFGLSVDLVEFGGEQDHVHLLVSCPPTVAVSHLVNSLKGASSRILRRDFPELVEQMWKDVLWSPSYFAATTGGASLDTIKQYISKSRRRRFLQLLKGLVSTPGTR